MSTGLSAWFLLPVAIVALWLVLWFLHDLDQYFREYRYGRRLDAEIARRAAAERRLREAARR